MSDQVLNPNTIKAWRKRQGISTQDLAKALSVSRITVERWEQWDSRDPQKPKATPTGPAEAILRDLIQAEDHETQTERVQKAIQISGLVGASASPTPGVAGLVATAGPLAAFGLAGYGLYQMMKSIWEHRIVCPNCQQTGPINAKFCLACGTKLPARVLIATKSPLLRVSAPEGAQVEITASEQSFEMEPSELEDWVNSEGLDDLKDLMGVEPPLKVSVKGEWAERHWGSETEAMNQHTSKTASPKPSVAMHHRKKY